VIIEQGKLLERVKKGQSRGKAARWNPGAGTDQRQQCEAAALSVGTGGTIGIAAT